MRTGIVNCDQASRTDLGKQTADLLLTKHNSAVTEEKVNCAVNCGFRARFNAALDPVRETRGLDAFLCLGADDRVVLDRDDSSEAVRLQALRQRDSAVSQKGTGFHDQLRLDGGNQHLQEIEHLKFR